jgi:hypothetical protein
MRTSKISPGDYSVLSFFLFEEIFEIGLFWHSKNPERPSSIYNMIDYDVFAKFAMKKYVSVRDKKYFL